MVAGVYVRPLSHRGRFGGPRRRHPPSTRLVEAEKRRRGIFLSHGTTNRRRFLNDCSIPAITALQCTCSTSRTRLNARNDTWEAVFRDSPSITAFARVRGKTISSSPKVLPLQLEVGTASSSGIQSCSNLAEEQ